MRPRFKLLAFCAVAAMATHTAHAVPVIGVTTDNKLFDFDTTAVGVNNLRSITGLSGTLFSIDFRPATGALYALTSSAGTGMLYTIDTVTGVATLSSTISVSLDGTTFDIGFNPVPDRLRIVSDTGQNLRVDVSTGVAVVDGTLNYGGATAQGIVAAAYTNQVAGAATTTLYTLDSVRGTLNTQNPPNGGAQNSVGFTGAPQLNSFDIDAVTGTGYVGDGGLFAQVNLTTGVAAGIGLYGINTVQDFSIVQSAQAVPEPMSLALLGAGLGGMLLVRRKTRGT